MHHWNNSKPVFILCRYLRGIAAVIAVSIAASVDAQDWETVNFIQHSLYQAVNSDGTSAYLTPVDFRSGFEASC